MQTTDSNRHRTIPSLALAVLILASCSSDSPVETALRPSAPCSSADASSKAVATNDTIIEPAEPACTPEIVMDNLERAFVERDKELYETLLDDGFWFTEENCLGDVVFENGKEQELAIMGPRDGSSQGIFDIFRTIEYEFIPIERTTELGRDFPLAFEGDPDGHPDEDWEVFRGRVQILLLEAPDEGSRVDQNMNFKLRQGADGLWRIRRWTDDALAGDCEADAGTEDDAAAKRNSGGGLSSWAQVKR